MKLRKLAVGLFVTAAALFIPMSAVWAAIAPTIPDNQSGSISVTATATDGGEPENVPVVVVSNKSTVEADATVIVHGFNGIFQVKTDDGQTVYAPPSGKMRMNLIRVLPGDKVRVEYSPDTMKGRIIRRYTN